MPSSEHLSDCCIINHNDEFVVANRPPMTPIWLLRIPLLFLDKRMHFNGLRGAAWRILGIGRSPKNPNICNA